MTQSPQQLAVAIIANEQTPYRIHLHRRISREMPEIELWSLFTHELASSPWRYKEDPEIRSVLFGEGELSSQKPACATVLKEWIKGGKIVRWLASHGIRVVVLFGYNDVARIRIVRWAAARGVLCFVFGDSNIRCDCAKGLTAILKRTYVPWILRQAAGVFHCGQLGREYFLRYGVPPSRLYAFPYEPDYEAFASPGTDACSEARRRYSLTEGRHYLLYSGRMIAAKRPDLLLDAFKRIALDRPEWDLVMVGDGPLRSELQDAAGGSVGDRVHWIGFIDDPGKLAALYAICDVFVLPSDYEPWGVVLTEAATHLALVASSVVGAAAEVILDGVNGRIFPQGDTAGLREALLDVTTPGRSDALRSASPDVLARWRRSTDPVRNLRRALHDARLLRGDSPAIPAA